MEEMNEQLNKQNAELKETLREVLANQNAMQAAQQDAAKAAQQDAAKAAQEAAKAAQVAQAKQASIEKLLK